MFIIVPLQQFRRIFSRPKQININMNSQFYRFPRQPYQDFRYPRFGPGFGPDPYALAAPVDGISLGVEIVLLFALILLIFMIVYKSGWNRYDVWIARKLSDPLPPSVQTVVASRDGNQYIARMTRNGVVYPVFVNEIGGLRTATFISKANNAFEEKQVGETETIEYYNRPIEFVSLNCAHILSEVQKRLNVSTADKLSSFCAIPYNDLMVLGYVSEQDELKTLLFGSNGVGNRVFCEEKKLNVIQNIYICTST